MLGAVDGGRPAPAMVSLFFLGCKSIKIGSFSFSGFLFVANFILYMYDIECTILKLNLLFLFIYFSEVGWVGLIELCYDVLGVLIGLWMKIYKIELPG